MACRFNTAILLASLSSQKVPRNGGQSSRGVIRLLLEGKGGFKQGAPKDNAPGIKPEAFGPLVTQLTSTSRATDHSYLYLQPSKFHSSSSRPLSVLTGAARSATAAATTTTLLLGAGPTLVLSDSDATSELRLPIKRTQPNYEKI